MSGVHRAASGQIIPKEKKAYNERLFGSGWRRRLHESRYTWLREKMKALQLEKPTILELGCFDAKTIDYLPHGFSSYVGYDANWENGLQLGRQRWGTTAGVRLVESHEPATFNPGNERFQCSIALETLEHLPQAELDEYLRKLQAATEQYLFVTVPYEQGLPLLAKYIYKSVLFKVDEPYSFRELVTAVSGKPSRVARLERGHKGFDYRRLADRLSVYFDVVEITGLPFSFLPKGLNFSLGIVAKARK